MSSLTENVPSPDGVDEQRFIDAMMHEDPIGSVVRGLIYIEHELIALSAEACPNPDALKGMKLTYSGRVCLAVALGLAPSLQSPLEALGRLRNKFAHDPAFDLSTRAINDIAATLDNNLRSAIQRSITRLGSEHPATFEGQTDRNRLTIIIVCLRQAVRAARILAAQRRDQASH